MGSDPILTLLLQLLIAVRLKAARGGLEVELNGSPPVFILTTPAVSLETNLIP